MTIANTEVKVFLISTIFLILILSVRIHAELPYESEHKHSFVVTAGLNKNERFNDNYQNSFSFNYSFQNKISIGISYRDFAGRFAIYEGTGQQANTGFLNSAEGSSNERAYSYPDRTYYSLYAQVKPLNIFKIDAPLSFSLFVAVQDVSDSKDSLGLLGIQTISASKIFVGNVHIYKKFNINSTQSLQPIISIGYRDIAYVSDSRLIRYGAALIYTYSLNKNTDILLAPQVYRFRFSNEFTVQVGISHGL